MKTHRHAGLILSVMLASGCAEGPSAEPAGALKSSIMEASPVVLGNLPGMVKVKSALGFFCTGMVISNDTILTAAHCVCTTNYVGGSVCHPEVTVVYPPNVAAPSKGVVSRAGLATYHPYYQGSLTEQQIEHDLAVIKLEGVGPAHASSFVVANDYPAVGSRVMVAGYGHTGEDCDGPYGSPNYDFAPVGSYQDGHDILVFNDEVLCGGDSGGPVLKDDGTLSPRRLFAVNSHWTWELTHGYISQTVTTSTHFDWIKSFMCPSTSRNHCNGSGDLCSCTGRVDILWRHTTTGEVAIWGMNGHVAEAAKYHAVPDLAWQIKGTGDFNGDGHADIVWRHSNGQVAIWHMDNGTRLYDTYPGSPIFRYAPVPRPGLTWTIVGIGDFDANGRSDILWRENGGQLAMWMDGTETIAAYPSYWNQGGPVDTNWKVEGVGDFDGDARSDILWRQSMSGETAVWLMSGGSMVGEWYPGTLGTSNTLQAIGDFDGNRRSDILWRDYDGSLRIWFNGGQIVQRTIDGMTQFESANSNKMRGPSFYNQLDANQLPAAIDLAWKVERVGDFNRDGRDDILWRHAGGGLAIWKLDGVQFLGDPSPGWVDPALWKLEGALYERGF